MWRFLKTKEIFPSGNVSAKGWFWCRMDCMYTAVLQLSFFQMHCQMSFLREQGCVSSSLSHKEWLASPFLYKLFFFSPQENLSPLELQLLSRMDRFTHTSKQGEERLFLYQEQTFLKASKGLWHLQLFCKALYIRNPTNSLYFQSHLTEYYFRYKLAFYGYQKKCRCLSQGGFSCWLLHLPEVQTAGLTPVAAFAL